MTDQELNEAKRWAEFWTKMEHWAFAGVVITLALEFMALKFGEPHKKKLDEAKDLRIEELRNQNLKLEEQLAPRFLTPIQQSGLQEELSKIGPRGLDVICCNDSAEVFQFSQMLGSPIKSAGWDIRIWTAIGGGVSGTGICVEEKAGSDPNGLIGLVNALKSQGIDATEIKFSTNWDKLPCALGGPTWDPNKIAPIRMWIGVKPQRGLTFGLPASPQ